MATATGESPTKKTKRNVITVTEDFDIRKDRFVEMDDDPYEIDREDCRILDELIRIQREPKGYDPIEAEPMYFFGRRRMVEGMLRDINKTRSDYNYPRVCSLYLSPYIGHMLPRCILGLSALETLNLEYSSLERIPPWIAKLKNLKELSLPSSWTLHEVPNEIWDLPKLEFFKYVDRNLMYVEEEDDNSTPVSIPPSIGKLQNLKTLIVQDVIFLPHEIGNLSTLEHLALANYKLSVLPTSIGNLSNLKHLEIGNSPYLRLLPETIGNLANLNKLSIYGLTKLRSLPESVGKLVNLKELELIHLPMLQSIQEVIGDLTNLEDLTIEQLPIDSLPTSMSNLRKLRRLSLSDNEYLTALPDWLGAMASMETLSLDNSPIESLPNSIGNLAKLKSLSLEASEITSLPTSVGNLSKLELLDVGRAKDLKDLPDEIGNLTKLQFLILSRSGIQSLPHHDDCLKNLKNLRYFRVNDTVLESNAIHRDALAKLPLDLPRLTCLGNIKYEKTPQDDAILNSLFFNRAKNMIFNGKDGQKPFPPASLWPLILAEDPQYFDAELIAPEKYDDTCRWTEEYQSQEDFIFQILTEYGPRFLSQISK